MGVVSEFKTFINQGSVVDLAVGVIIGGAFGKIVTSLVDDIIMPPIGLAIGGVDFAKLALVLKPAVGTPGAEGFVDAVSINYGNFIQVVFQFLIIAFVIFMLVKGINRMKAVVEPEVAAPVAEPAEPTKEEQLLTEIRDAIKQRGL
jgi:large conductance mechanosensitive channel